MSPARRDRTLFLLSLIDAAVSLSDCGSALWDPVNPAIYSRQGHSYYPYVQSVKREERAHGLTERLPRVGSGIASFANGPGSRCGWVPRHRFSAG